MPLVSLFLFLYKGNVSDCCAYSEEAYSIVVKTVVFFFTSFCWIEDASMDSCVVVCDSLSH